MEALNFVAFCVAICLHFTFSYSLECLSCQNIDDPRTCNSTTPCQNTQVCYLDVSAGIYKMGCADNQHCGGISSVGIIGRDVTSRQTSNCLECCSSDSCNLDLCKHMKPTLCIDDETVDCARMNTIFHVCKDIQQAKLVCPKFCGLCQLVDGQWSVWSSWSNCDVTCGLGIQTKTRTCTNPAPANGGLDCIGNSTDTKQCHNDPCPVHGKWSNWGSWGSCSVSCDVGMQRRDRSCSNPYPSRNGDHCFGESRDDRLCFPGACAELKVAFTAYNLDTSSSSHTTLVFRSVYINYGNAYSTSTGKFTCKVPGLYHFSVTLTKAYNVKLDYVEAFLRINAISKLEMWLDPYDNEDKLEIGATPLTQSGTLHLNKNDVVYIWDYPHNFINIEFSTFTGYLITPF